METNQTKLYQDYDFNSIEEFYDYIIDTSLNGQFSQLRDLLNKVDKSALSNYFNGIALPKDAVLRIFKYA